MFTQTLNYVPWYGISAQPRLFGRLKKYKNNTRKNIRKCKKMQHNNFERDYENLKKTKQNKIKTGK